MVLLEPKFKNIKLVNDYKPSQIKLKLDHINVIEKNDFYKKTGEMILTCLVQTTIGNKILQAT